jgi:hypothetical protein
MSAPIARSVLPDAAARSAEVVGTHRPWGDPGREPLERVDYLIARMTVKEKISQLVGLWVGADSSGAGVAPHQDDMSTGVFCGRTPLPVGWVS